MKAQDSQKRKGPEYNPSQACSTPRVFYLAHGVMLCLDVVDHHFQPTRTHHATCSESSEQDRGVNEGGYCNKDDQDGCRKNEVQMRGFSYKFRDGGPQVRVWLDIELGIQLNNAEQPTPDWS